MDGTHCLGISIAFSYDRSLRRKIEAHELPIPTAWRPALKQLADKAILGTEIKTLSNIKIGQIDSETKSIHRYNIDEYPDTLGPLDKQTWETSIYIWDSPYWRVLIDLTDLDGHITDLVLHARVHETDNGFSIEPGLIYVP